jgi:hypothetical protein
VIAFLPLITAPATSLDWTAFLPLAGAILGGCIGAVGGAWANSWYRDREAKKAEDQEREGLLRLLAFEVKNNNAVLEAFINVLTEDPDNDIRAEIATTFDVEVWHESRVRLAHLLPSDDLVILAEYFWDVDFTRQTWEAPNREEWSAEDDKEEARRTMEEGVRVGQVAQEYVSDPEFVSKLLPQIGSGLPSDSNEVGPT